MQKQVQKYPDDARGRMQLSYAYRAAGDMERARAELRAAIELSPKKESFWIEAGALEWDAGNVKEAQKDFNTAYALGPQFRDLADYAAAGAIAAGDPAEADRILMAAYGTTAVDSDVLSIAYYRAKNWTRLIELWKRRAHKDGATVETWFSLAAAYYAAGDRASAIGTIREAVKLFPSATASGDAAIRQIQAGQ
jgi:tetratricopeptide (TPR) repeat protein